MGLTRPKIWDINTDIAYFADPITVLHQGATSPNQDVGFLFNRANGLVSNVAVYWSEAEQSVVTAFTTNTGQTNANIVPTSFANLTVGSILTIAGAAIKFYANAGIILNGSSGHQGEVLTASGTGGLTWAAPGGFAGGYVPNQLIANVGLVSTSVSSGSFLVNGGMGVTGNINVGENVNTSGNVIIGSANVVVNSRTITNVGTSPILLDSFSVTSYRSAKYVLSVTDVVNFEHQTNEVMLIHNTMDAYISSYGLVYTGSTPKMTFTSNVISGNVALWGTGVSANNTVKVYKTQFPL